MFIQVDRTPHKPDINHNVGVDDPGLEPQAAAFVASASDSRVGTLLLANHGGAQLEPGRRSVSTLKREGEKSILRDFLIVSASVGPIRTKTHRSVV